VYLLLTGLATASPGSLIALLHRLSPSGVGPETIHSSMGRFLPFYYGTMTVVTSAMAAAELNAHERYYNGWATTFNTHTSEESSFDLDLHPHPGMYAALKKVLAFR
jgi:hypothetical protein